MKLIRYHRRVRVDPDQYGLTGRETVALVVPCVPNSETPNTICGLVRKAQKYKTRLCLHIDGDTMTANESQPKRFNVRSKEALLFSQVTNLFESPRSRPPTADMNRLALILGFTLLQLYDNNVDGPMHWISPNWMKRDGIWKTPKWTDHIRFYHQNQVKKKVDIQQPFLLSQTNGHLVAENLPFDNPDDLNDAMHRAPAILALGKALLDLYIAYFGLPFVSGFDSEDSEMTDDDDSEDSSDSSEDGHPNINTDYTEALNLRDTYRDKIRSSNFWYYEAIDACLKPNPDPTLSVREYIYQSIVKPLKLNYHINSPSPEKLQNRLDEMNGERKRSKAVHTEDAIKAGWFDRGEVCLYGDDMIPIDSGAYAGTISYTKAQS